MSCSAYFVVDPSGSTMITVTTPTQLLVVRIPVKGQQHFPVGGQLISLLADRLFPCPRSADLLLI